MRIHTAVARGMAWPLASVFPLLSLVAATLYLELEAAAFARAAAAAAALPPDFSDVCAVGIEEVGFLPLSGSAAAAVPAALASARFVAEAPAGAAPKNPVNTIHIWPPSQSRPVEVECQLSLSSSSASYGPARARHAQDKLRRQCQVLQGKPTQFEKPHATSLA